MTFRFRLPKPLHGWKALFHEVFVIVIGVLIALGFGQAVEWMSWREKVADGEELLKNEALLNIGTSAEAYAVGPCIKAQVELIRRNLSGGSQRQALPRNDIGIQRSVVVVPQRPMYSAVWQALTSDGTLNHMAPARLNAWSSLYEVAVKLGSLGVSGFEQSHEFNVLAEPIAIDPASSFVLLTRANTLEQTMMQASVVANRSFEFYQTLGLEIPEDRIEAFVSGSPTAKFCKSRGLPLADWRNAYRQKLHPLSL